MNKTDLLTESYHYDLPAHFIADRPAPKREESKLMVYDQDFDRITHTTFKNLPDFLKSGDMLVLNQSKVFPCRLLGQKSSGGKAELFILSLIDQDGIYPAMIRSNGKKHLGDIYHFGDLEAKIVGVPEAGDFLVSFNLGPKRLLQYLEAKAHIPIPPYIRGGIADEKDKNDYQTVYAKKMGSVAAPTAGLHFTEKVFEDCESKGIDKAFVTLHVGAGTFKTVSSENINDHKMHSEFYEIERDQLEKINKASRRIAVGTTSLRVLESSYRAGEITFNPPIESTEIFLHPGVNVHSIGGLITNFHLPKSTLLMLVSSLLGREKTLELYKVAIENKYRFFSYGDAMLILRSQNEQ